jgi:hypothetical protein
MLFLQILISTLIGAVLGVVVAVALNTRSLNPMTIGRAIRQDLSR